MKLAVCFTGGRHDDERVVRAMLAAQDVDGAGGHRVVTLPEGGAIGWLPTAERFAPFALARQGARGNLLLVSGAPILIGGSLPALLDDALEASLPDATRALTRLDGGFAALFWDAQRRQLAAVTDFLGMQPLFEARAPGALLLATEQKGLLATGLVDDAPDAAGWGAFFSFGHYLGRRTSLQRVRWAAAGAVTVYDPERGTADERPHWRWPEPAPHRSLDEVDTAGIYRALTDSVGGYRAYGRDGVVLMSGGFDSRLVLRLVQDAGLSPRALVVRHEEELYDADTRYAVAAARRLGIEPEVARPAADFYASDAYRRYLQLSELANPSIGLFIARVSAFVRPEHGALWEGLAPNAMQRSERNPEHGGFAAYLPRACRGESSAAWRGVRAVFAPDWVREMEERFGELLREEVARYRDDEFGVFEFSVRNRTRNRLGTNPFKVFGVDALPFTPGITRDFYERMYSLSGRLRGVTALRARIMRERMPEALDVPFCSGGKLISVTPGLHPSLRLARVRARLLKPWLVRRVLERTGLHRPFAFDLETVKRDLLASVDLDDPRLNRVAARDIADRQGTGNVADRASEQLFYWHVKRLVLRRPHDLRERRPEPDGWREPPAPLAQPEPPERASHEAAHANRAVAPPSWEAEPPRA